MARSLILPRAADLQICVDPPPPGLFRLAVVVD